MAWMKTLKSLITLSPDLPFKAAPISTEYFGPTGQRAADWSGIGTSAKVRDVWAKCATAYACITLLADAVAESPLRVYREIDGEPEEQPAHRTRVLLANPNPVMSEAEFMSLNVMTMGLFGYSVVEKVRSGARIPVELWPLRPDWLKREYSSEGTRWVYRRPGVDPRVIADEDLIIVPYRHDPNQLSLGVSPLHIVAREVGIDVALTDLLKVFIDAGGIPPWVVKLTGDMQMDQAQADTFREKWRQRYGGSQAYSEIGILLPGMDLQKVGDSIGDMAWPDLRGLTELKIAQAFRVPADLIQARDTLGGSSLTTTEMDGAMAYLQNHGAQPLRTRIDGAFTRGLLADFTGGDSQYSLEFDTSAIMALQEDRDALHNRVRSDWQAGLITLNEARGETGRSDLGRDGEVLLQGFTTTYVPVRELNGNGAPQRASQGTTITPRAMPALTEGKRERVYRDLKALSPGELETRASILQTTRRERDKLAEIGARKLRAFFKAQGKRVVGDLGKSTSGSPFAVNLAEWAERDIKAGGLVDWDAEARRLWDEVMRQLYMSVGESAFGSVSATVGTSISWDLANPNISRIMDELGKRIVDISETTRTDVVRVITDGQAEGLNLQQIADNLTGMFEETYKSRSMTVARTETMLSYSKASVLGYQESGVVEQVELSDNVDHDEDYGASDGLTCAQRDGLVVELGEVDRHIEAEHPNGSLAVIPILSEPLGEV